MDGAPHAAAPLVFSCLRPGDEGVIFEQLTDLSQEQWTTLLDVAGELMVMPVLAARLLSPALTAAVPDDVRRTLAAERRLMAIRNLRIHADLHRVIAALHRHQIPVIVLKGLHLATLIYDDMAIRTIGDIDLLVRAGDLATVGAALREIGYAPRHQYQVGADATSYEEKHLPRFLKSGATDVEIHWHVRKADAGDSLDINEFWDRAVAARIAGADVDVLSPEDLLLHLCIHATVVHLCETSAQRWCDIAAVVAKYGASLSWEDVIARATRWRCRNGTYLALRLAATQAGAAVPHEVLHRLRPEHFDEQIVTAVMKNSHRLQVAGTLTSLHGEPNVVARLRLLGRRIFLPTRQIANRYHLSPSSWLVYPFYAVWLRDLAKGRWQTVLALHRGDPALLTQIHDTEVLQKFVTAE